jgi:hypothetical protein
MEENLIYKNYLIMTHLNLFFNKVAKFQNLIKKNLYKNQFLINYI